MFQNPAYKKERHLTQPRITVPGKQWFAIFPKGDVRVHARTVIGEERLWHEGDGLVMLPRDVTNDIFVILHRIAHLFERRETDIDFSLASGGYFMMLFVHGHARFLQLERHFVADILQRVHWRNWEIALLRSNLVTDIRKF